MWGYDVYLEVALCVLVLSGACPQECLTIPEVVSGAFSEVAVHN
jgi:hypothetical protein